MSNSELTKNSKEIKELERLLSFPFASSEPVPGRDPNVKALQQGSILKVITKRTELQQLERLLKL